MIAAAAPDPNRDGFRRRPYAKRGLMRSIHTTCLALMVLLGVTLAGSASAAETVPPEERWWAGFGDPVLSELVDIGLANNPDLGIARTKIEQADAATWQGLAPLLPQFSFDLNGNLNSIEMLGGATPPGETWPETYKTGSAMLVGRLNADIFGKQILSQQATRRDRDAATESGEVTTVELAASIARTYYQLVAAQNQVATVKRQIETNQQLLDLTQLRYERGEAEGLDVLQQRQQLAATHTLLPQAEAIAAAAKKNLVLLLGGADEAELPSPVKALPMFEPMAPIKPTADAIVELPAVRLSASQLAAAKARRLSATMSFFPTVQVTGQAGQQATYIDELEDQFVWTLGAGISIPLFQGGQNLGTYRFNAAKEREAQHTLRKAELAAQNRLDIAQVEEDQYRRQLAAYHRQLEAADEALRQSESRYTLGLTNFQSVLTSLTARQQAELNVINSHLSLVLARVELHQALGGKRLAGSSPEETVE